MRVVVSLFAAFPAVEFFGFSLLAVRGVRVLVDQHIEMRGQHDDTINVKLSEDELHLTEAETNVSQAVLTSPMQKKKKKKRELSYLFGGKQDATIGEKSYKCCCAQEDTSINCGLYENKLTDAKGQPCEELAGTRYTSYNNIGYRSCKVPDDQIPEGFTDDGMRELTYLFRNGINGKTAQVGEETYKCCCASDLVDDPKKSTKIVCKVPKTIVRKLGGQWNALIGAGLGAAGGFGISQIVGAVVGGAISGPAGAAAGAAAAGGSGAAAGAGFGALGGLWQWKNDHKDTILRVYSQPCKEIAGEGYHGWNSLGRSHKKLKGYNACMVPESEVPEWA